jgi:hypothetical protein
MQAVSRPWLLGQTLELLHIDHAGRRVVRDIVPRVRNHTSGRSDDFPTPTSKLVVLRTFSGKDLQVRAQANYVVGELLAPLVVAAFNNVSIRDDKVASYREDQLSLLGVRVHWNVDRLPNRPAVGRAHLQLVRDPVDREGFRLAEVVA